MSEPKHLSLGGIALPIDIDALEALPTSGGTMHFDFTYRGVHFAAKCEDAEGSARVKVVGDLGRMPFSAEAPAARSGLSAIILHANGLLGRIFHLAGERILVGRETSVAAPVTATGLLAAMAALLIPVSPYLDLAAVYFESGGDRLKPEWRVRARPGAPPAPRLTAR